MSRQLTERHKALAISGTRDFVERLLATAQAFDISDGGLYDARSGCINVWCSPEDRPSCWAYQPSQSNLGYLYEYVGGLYWDWVNDTTVNFRFDCVPYQLIANARKVRRRKYDQPILTDDEWDNLMVWLEAKITDLIRLANLHPTIVGIRCPCCSYVLPPTEIINVLVAHIVTAHQEITVTGVTLGRQMVINTTTGDLPLVYAEQF